MGERPSWDGSFREITLSEIPADWLPEGLELEGIIDADADLTVIDMARLEGDFSLQAREGKVNFEQMPLPLRYDTLEADFEFGGDQFAVVKRFELKGPMVSGSASGKIGNAEQLGDEPLDLEVDVQVENPLILGLLQGANVGLDRTGKANLNVGGTLRKPEVQR